MPKTLPESAKTGIEILIVEDSPTQLLQLQHLLEQNGYQVTTADNGRLALEVLSKHKPKIVISDIFMPEMDGYELCRAIKSDQSLEDIPVILMTSLTDLQGAIKGMECGADNFICKPYDEKYLLARIDYLLMNRMLRKNEKVRLEVEIYLQEKRYFFTVERQQILDLLISVYEGAVRINEELEKRKLELANSNKTNVSLYLIADGLNHAVSEREVIDKAMECTLEMPGMRACWIALYEDESGFRLAGARNLPSVLTSPGALEGDCLCRRQLLSGELYRTINVIDCECIKRLQQDTGITGQHISIPININDRHLGIMNLLQTEERSLSNNELQTLQGIGNQIAIALTRAQMHQQLEQMVEQRTKALKAEIAEHKQTEQTLRTTEGRLQSILSSITDVIWSISAQTHQLQYLNPAAERIYGRPKSDFFNNSTLWFEMVHPADRELMTQYTKNLFAGVTGSLEYRIVKPNGEVSWLYDRAQMIYDDGGAPSRIDGITTDISERKNTHDKLKKALNEKEVLLKEVYHRVKNNLQVVSSLINLQARNANNEETTDQLKQSADRITSMALLHEKLYQSKDLARIDFNAYVHSLVEHLLSGHGDHSGKIKISMKIDDVFLDVDTAIPCGLIINELLTNALKHAFPDDRHGEIGITFTQDQDESILVITDNGIGFPTGMDFKERASLGLQLVITLTSQLMGDITLDHTRGSAFTIRFTNFS